ncbi:heavy metal translocating P-type ATPase [Microbacterium karelineae]|uniref:heavy metal translocating P-type ATPase n=1 Tax=Microbacterium karelineae TaxID=2654283 RepID=UPI0012E9C7CF|nr:heavy metal translocating P-type ATPase [Microbacterium karelineae]
MNTTELDLDIRGMTCASCANRIERRLTKLDGVSAQVNYATEKAHIAFPDTTTPDELIRAVEAAGYGAALPEPDADDDREAHLRQVRTRLVWSTALSTPVVVLAMIPPLQFPGWQWVSLVLAVPVVVWGGWGFHRAAWANLRHGAATMDTLVSVGTIAALGWSLYALVFGTAGEIGMSHGWSLLARHADGSGSIYLEAAAGVTTFILAGRFIEARSKLRAGDALRALLDVGAKDVAVRASDGSESRIPVARLRVDDAFVVRPGERIATDGVVIEGSSAVDQSMVTGEPVPAEVAPGDTVVGGTINAGGLLVVRATRVGSDTQLAQMAKLVEEAQTSKAGAQRLADRVAGIFVPIVFVIATGTLAAWLLLGQPAAAAFTAAVAVLIIACPCALGLATPLALMIGTGRGAQQGILIKDSDALERARRIDTIVLDKTGTVTAGEMTLSRVIPGSGESADEVLRIAAALESGSEHPIARAIAAAAANGSPRHAPSPDDGRARHGESPGVSDFRNLEGLGAQGIVDGHAVVIGRPRLLDEWGASLTDELRAAFDWAHAVRTGSPIDASAASGAHSGDEQSTGATVVAVAWDGKARGVIAVADTVKPTSAEAVAALRDLGLEPVLVTGDAEEPARAVAAEVGIDRVIAGVLPHEKVSVVKDLQAEGRRVAMVGDGINDAAALAQADLGMAMGTGTDVAIEASDLTLVRGDLRVAADAVRLSRRTLGIIRGNLFWAFAYNVAAIPVAALGLLAPMLAGAAMAFSSVFVVLNSLRLKRSR